MAGTLEPGKKGATKTLKIEWLFPDWVTTVSMDRAVLNYVTEEGTFVLSFFQFDHPVFAISAAEKAKQLESLETLRAKCVSRIAMTSQQLARMAELILNQLEAHGELKLVKQEGEPHA